MATTDELAMARLFLERMGISLEELSYTDPRPTAPTIAEFVPTVSGAVPAGTRRTYTPYWHKLVHVWGAVRIDEINATDINWFIGHARTTAVVRRSSRGGHSAALHAYRALRCLYRYAIWNRVLDPRDDPTELVTKPKTVRSTRHAIDNGLLSDIVDVASTTGNDPALDAIIIRLHLETAARRAGGLGIRPRDLDPQRSLIRLREKGDITRWQPVSPTLMTNLLHLTQTRGHRDDDTPILRNRKGKPITARRYDHLWERIGEHIDTVRTLGITTHWLRHTTLTWVERNFGYAVARAYAGHAASSTRTGVTTTYVRAGISEVAEALAALTGDPHPLAPKPL
ncbi:site-specific recombinase XerD [Saccharothrix saharensis]|uniref:Site-specific recombinase XerD n=1 Tax=Saccharothrix saharensis TaxID=571190 RepID=A0A543J5P5_9PSEU|nr:site-specific integrase [Saccharothrix saharensis]TQM78149.1 site-specific recombinase XerD [Saccharothrix saharensis]